MKGIMSRGLVHVIIPKRYNITVSKNRTRMPRIVTDLFIFPFRISSVTALQFYSF